MRILHLPLLAAAALGLGACPPHTKPPVDEPAFGWLQAQHGGGPIGVTYEFYDEAQVGACGVVADGHEADAPRRRYAFHAGPEDDADAGQGWLGEAVVGDGPHWTEPQCLERLELLSGEVRP